MNSTRSYKDLSPKLAREMIARFSYQMDALRVSCNINIFLISKKYFHGLIYHVKFRTYKKFYTNPSQSHENLELKNCKKCTIVGKRCHPGIRFFEKNGPV